MRIRMRAVIVHLYSRGFIRPCCQFCVFEVLHSRWGDANWILPAAPGAGGAGDWLPSSAGEQLASQGCLVPPSWGINFSSYFICLSNALNHRHTYRICTTQIPPSNPQPLPQPLFPAVLFAMTRLGILWLCHLFSHFCHFCRKMSTWAQIWSLGFFCLRNY